VMEFLRGRSLAKLVEERGGALGEQEAVGYILKVCDALKVVHKKGYLHRDIKPENIIVCEDGRVVLIDFGAARAYMAGKTRRMTVILTPGYAPLEQYTEQAKRGAYTDIYALGATLYHLLTGQVPPTAPDRVQGVNLVPPHQLNPKVSRHVSDAVMKAMEMKVDERPQSVEEFVKLLTSPVITAPKVSVPSAAQVTPPPVVGGAREWCPACRANFYVADPSQKWVHCPNCGQLVHRQVSVKGQQGQKIITGEKDPVAAGLLSFFFPGSGQIYNGQVAKGLVLLVLWAILFLLACCFAELLVRLEVIKVTERDATLLIPGIVQLVSIVDAVRIARKLQRGQAVSEWEWF